MVPAAVALAAAPARSQPAWPARPLRLMVPQAPGGAVDLVSRVVAERLEPALGVAVVVENKPGASGLIGVEAVKRAAHDGYTLLAASSNTHAMLPHLMGALPYDPIRDFAPVVNFAYTTKMIVVSNAVEATTLSELVSLARERPGLLNYGTSGIGSSNHLDAEVFARATGIRLVHVPYRGSAQALNAVTTGEVQMMLVSVTSGQSLVRAGRVRGLAVFGEQRAPQLPAVPTMAECGYPGLDVRTWVGFVVPAGTPAAIVDRLNREIVALLGTTVMREWLVVQGLEAAGGTPAQFASTLRADYAKWGAVVRELGLREAATVAK
jgi:tripartite-type tricarboxylate transporter receptor subunit TctC